MILPSTATVGVTVRPGTSIPFTTLTKYAWTVSGKNVWFGPNVSVMTIVGLFPGWTVICQNSVVGEPASSDVNIDPLLAMLRSSPEIVELPFALIVNVPCRFCNPLIRSLNVMVPVGSPALYVNVPIVAPSASTTGKLTLFWTLTLAGIPTVTVSPAFKTSESGICQL